VRPSPALAVAAAVTGWLSLECSVFGALAASGKTLIGVFLGGAGLLGLVAAGFALRGMATDRTTSGAIHALIGLILAVGLLIAGVYWGLAEYNR
jgi:hypothetical protein